MGSRSTEYYDTFTYEYKIYVIGDKPNEYWILDQEITNKLINFFEGKTNNADDIMPGYTFTKIGLGTPSKPWYEFECYQINTKTNFKRQIHIVEICLPKHNGGDPKKASVILDKYKTSCDCNIGGLKTTGPKG